MAPRLAVAAACAAALVAASRLPAALTITPTVDANVLAAVRDDERGGITVTDATLFFSDDIGGELSSGTFAVSAPPDTYTFTRGGVVLSTGDVADVATGPNTTPCEDGATGCLDFSYGLAASDPQEALLDPITGGDFVHYDVSQLDIEFDVDEGVDTLYFRLAFGSDEFPFWFETIFNDGFGLYLNGTNHAFVDSDPINISHPSTAPRPGTQLNGLVLDAGSPAFTLALAVTGGSKGNLLQLILGDASDSFLDTAVYVSALGSDLPSGAIFINGFPDPCVTGWSGDVGFVPNCATPPAAAARNGDREAAIAARLAGAPPR